LNGCNNPIHRFLPNSDPSDPPLPLPAVLPGLVMVSIVDVMAVSGMMERLQVIHTGWLLVAAIVPWVTLLVMRRGPAALGYHRRRAVANFGWGALFGLVWRGLSMTLNLWLIDTDVFLGLNAGDLVSALILVPLVEETFFRGYLGRSLSIRFGYWRGIVMQALLFGLLPAHCGQGWIAMTSILAFGVLAGWLVQRTGSLWIAWGAHGAANIFPLLLMLAS
jgi:membrane protease YdiL (CAAX protease family)